MDFLIYICPKCQKIYKVQGDGKKVKCSNCVDALLVDSFITVDQWQSKSKEEKVEVKNRVASTYEVVNSIETNTDEIPAPIDTLIKEEKTGKKTSVFEEAKKNNKERNDKAISSDNSHSFFDEAVNSTHNNTNDKETTQPHYSKRIEFKKVVPAIVASGLLFIIVLTIWIIKSTKFDITGAWQSVGDYGFGQAQPGRYVIFDKSGHCNFVSPQDTYSLEKEGGKYNLSIVGISEYDNWDFEVDVINDNYIIITSPRTMATSLERKSDDTNLMSEKDVSSEEDSYYDDNELEEAEPPVVEPPMEPAPVQEYQEDEYNQEEPIVDDFDVVERNIDLEWHTYSVETKDNNYVPNFDSGYTFKQTYTFSPWISGENRDVIEAYWSAVSNEPLYDFSHSSNMPSSNSGKTVFDYASDYYFVVGTLQTENITSGFDLSASKAAYNSFNIFVFKDKTGSKMSKNGIVSMGFKYGNSSDYIVLVNSPDRMKNLFDKDMDHPDPCLHMTMNQSSRIPCILALYSERTPKYPEGEFNPADVVFQLRPYSVETDMPFTEFTLPCYTE